MSAHAEVGHEVAHHAVHVPWSDIYPQVFNFALFAILLIWLTRKNVITYFMNRRDQFTAALVKAQTAKQEAETQKLQFEKRLRELNNNAEDTLRQAQVQADALRAQILNEAQALSKTLRDEAQKTARHEVERAKTELRELLLEHSVRNARQILSEKLREPDQRRLQTEFVDKIQVVR